MKTILVEFFVGLMLASLLIIAIQDENMASLSISHNIANVGESRIVQVPSPADSNEPTQGAEKWQALAQRIVDAMREVDQNHLVGRPGQPDGIPGSTGGRRTPLRRPPSGPGPKHSLGGSLPHDPHLEFGNELWGTAQADDPYFGASLMRGLHYD